MSNQPVALQFYEEKPNDLAQAFAQRRRGSEMDRETKKVEKPTKTKEELAAIRKAMMKPKSRQNTSLSQVSESQTSSQKELPPNLLLSRLAKGERAEIDKKEFRKLTSKNYENLPEVQKKREQDRKKEEMKARKEAVKRMDNERKLSILGGKK